MLDVVGDAPSEPCFRFLSVGLDNELVLPPEGPDEIDGDESVPEEGVEPGMGCGIVLCCF